MQAVMESLFDVAYLIIVTLLGIKILKAAQGKKQYILFGIMALVLGFGDAFHLVPRIIALWTDGSETLAGPLGYGKLITSITMTLFYVMLYYVWRLRYRVEGEKHLTYLVLFLALARISLCLMPQNQWASLNPSYSWGIYRNIPFLLLGLLVIGLFYVKAKANKDTAFKWIWLTIVLSFAFYVPVVIWTDQIPMMGMLMIPKTCAYVWTVWIGYKAIQQENTANSHLL